MGKMVSESRTEWRFAIRLRRERPSSRQGVLAPAKAGFVRSRANQGGTTKAMLSSLAGVSGKGRELFVAATERKKQTHE